MRSPREAPFRIGPDFAHDEVRRYAVARLLLATGNLASRVRNAGAPRWSLAAARLACQAWLAQPETSIPLEGRFAEQQASFDALVNEGHGSRWGDVPSEALLTLANSEPLLRDAWPELLSDDAAGLRRLARVVDQRLRDKDGFVDVVAVAPIIALMLEASAPWRTGKYAQALFRAWLRGHVIMGTDAGHPLRVQLRQRLVEACVAADRRLAEESEVAVAAHSAWKTPDTQQQRELMELLESQSRLFSSIGYGRRHRRQRPDVPREITDEIVLEQLALLGPDIGDDGEAILRRVAENAPWCLCPAVDKLLTGRALSNGPPGLLADLTEAYYLDDEGLGFGFAKYGLRDHHWGGLGVPHAAWYRGPFMDLFRTDFRNGVAMLNRLLNHAARVRAQKLIDLDRESRHVEDTFGPCESELRISGAPQLYVGDDHVWRWYRGNGVGPYPCMSALQALERECDQLIGIEVPIHTLVSIMLDGCENLAMVGLIVGLLVRHLEDAGNLLDPYFTEPDIWHLEFARVVSEASPLSADSKEVVAPERRKWSFREAAMFLGVNAKGKRIVVLRTLGDELVANARRLLVPAHGLKATEEDTGWINQELATVRAWASSLDRGTYTAHKGSDGFYIQATPPGEVVQALANSKEDVERANEAVRLTVRYGVKEQPMSAIRPGELAADLNAAQKLFENSASVGPRSPWDAAALVSASALEAHLVEHAVLPDATLSFAVETLIGVGEGAAGQRELEFEGTLYELRADRSAARTLPLLLLPLAAQTRALVDGEDGPPAFERTFRASVNLARAVANEVRLHLARGLDHVWKASCTEQGRCHHELGLQIAAEMMRHCVLGPRGR